MIKRSLLILLAAFSGWAQSGPIAATNLAKAAQPVDLRAERIRESCINGRRFICGKVVQIATNGLVVDSGYSELLHPPFNQSWRVPGNVSIKRDANGVEGATPDSVCVGLVFLTDIPKRPAIQRYDYVVIHGYPAGTHAYTPVTNITKNIRQFSAGLERAVSLNLQAGDK